MNTRVLTRFCFLLQTPTGSPVGLSAAVRCRTAEGTCEGHNSDDAQAPIVMSFPVSGVQTWILVLILQQTAFSLKVCRRGVGGGGVEHVDGCRNCIPGALLCVSGDSCHLGFLELSQSQDLQAEEILGCPSHTDKPRSSGLICGCVRGGVLV